MSSAPVSGGSDRPGETILVRGGYVITCDPTLGELPGGDVEIRDGRITRVGRNLPTADGARVVDAAGKIVMPGMVDTHRHMWQATVAGVGGNLSVLGYFQVVMGRIAPHFEPDDAYAGVLWGALQALDAGVTTVVDWSHITNTPEHVDANLQALHDAQIAGIFLYGPPFASGDMRWGVDSELPHPDDARRVREQHFPSGANGRLSMGLGLRGPGAVREEVARADWALARELDVPLSIHCGLAGSAKRNRTVEVLGEFGLLGEDCNYAHGNQLAAREHDLIADSGGSISVTPTVELLMALGTYPATGAALERGIRCGLGADTVTGAGADLFSEMRLTLAAERSRANAEAIARDEAVMQVQLDQRDVLRLATLEGARCWGLQEEVGSLTPGKQGDVVVIDAGHVNLHPLGDPVATLVFNAGSSDVETVIVGGTVVKSDGRLVGPRVERARELVTQSRERVLARAQVGDVLGDAWAPAQADAVTG